MADVIGMLIQGAKKRAEVYGGEDPHGLTPHP